MTNFLYFWLRFLFLTWADFIPSGANRTVFFNLSLLPIASRGTRGGRGGGHAGQAGRSGGGYPAYDGQQPQQLQQPQRGTGRRRGRPPKVKKKQKNTLNSASFSRSGAHNRLDI
jgi:hypothetical protein